MDFNTPQFSLMWLLAALAAGVLIGAYLNSRVGIQTGSARSSKVPDTDTQRLAEKNARRLSSKARAGIEQLLAEDRIIEAVRDCRGELGCGLKEAKDVIDLIGAELTRKGPSSRPLH